MTVAYIFLFGCSSKATYTQHGGPINVMLLADVPYLCAWRLWKQVERCRPLRSVGVHSCGKNWPGRHRRQDLFFWDVAGINQVQLKHLCLDPTGSSPPSWGRTRLSTQAALGDQETESWDRGEGEGQSDIICWEGGG